MWFVVYSVWCPSPSTKCDVIIVIVTQQNGTFLCLSFHGRKMLNRISNWICSICQSLFHRMGDCDWIGHIFGSRLLILFAQNIIIFLYFIVVIILLIWITPVDSITARGTCVCLMSVYGLSVAHACVCVVCWVNFMFFDVIIIYFSFGSFGVLMTHGKFVTHEHHTTIRGQNVILSSLHFSLSSLPFHVENSTKRLCSGPQLNWVSWSPAAREKKHFSASTFSHSRRSHTHTNVQ